MLPNPQETSDRVKFNEEILKEKLHFLGRFKILNMKTERHVVHIK